MNLVPEPESGIFGWLMGAIRRIDFTMYNMIDDFFMVSHATQGAMRFTDLSALSWNEYNYVMEKSKEIVKNMYGEPNV